MISLVILTITAPIRLVCEVSTKIMLTTKEVILKVLITTVLMNCMWLGVFIFANKFPLRSINVNWVVAVSSLALSCILLIAFLFTRNSIFSDDLNIHTMMQEVEYEREQKYDDDEYEEQDDTFEEFEDEPPEDIVEEEGDTFEEDAFAEEQLDEVQSDEVQQVSEDSCILDELDPNAFDIFNSAFALDQEQETPVESVVVSDNIDIDSLYEED